LFWVFYCRQYLLLAILISRHTYFRHCNHACVFAMEFTQNNFFPLPPTRCHTLGIKTSKKYRECNDPACSRRKKKVQETHSVTLFPFQISYNQQRHDAMPREEKKKEK